jgi:zinc protease
LHTQGWVRAQHYNAMTNYERTLYLFSPPGGKRQLPLALTALGQMMGHAQITNGDLDTERRVVFEEWRTKLGVAERMNQQRVAAIRHNSRYPARPVIGTEESIAAMPAVQLRDFYRTWYVPSNMHLVITGDIDIENTTSLVNNAFGDLPASSVPARNYYDAVLQKQLRVVRLQDSQSGSSQVSFVFRLDESDSRVQDDAGARMRLIDQIALTQLTNQLRRQQAQLPQSISSLVVRKSHIGQNTAGLGFFVQVTPTGHMEGLTQLLTEIERVQRYSLPEKEFVEIKQDFQALAERKLTAPETREFSDWVQRINDSLVNQTPLMSQKQLAERMLRILPSVTQNDIHARIKQWLASPDRLVQFSIPGTTPFTLPTSQHIEKQIARLHQQTITPPVAPQVITAPTMSAPALEAVDAEIKRTPYPQQQVQTWELANKDRIVWLNTSKTGDRLQVSIQSNAGFMSPDLNPWQSQLAVQLINQSGPEGFSAEQFADWKKVHGVSMSADLDDMTLKISAQSKIENADQLFKLYHKLQTEAHIDQVAMKESLLAQLRSMASGHESISRIKQTTATKLRFGNPAYAMPGSEEIEALTDETLMAQWQRIVNAPVTYYVMGNIEAEELATLANTYLANLPRTSIAAPSPTLPAPGVRNEVSAMNLEPRSDIKLWMFTPKQWSPADAVRISIAKQLASQALKTRLRDEQQGIYRMQLDSMLNTKTNLVETEITFGSDPERSQHLLSEAIATLIALPEQITAEQVDAAKKQFIRAEQSRAQTIETVFSRLILSDRHYGNPQYLSEAAHLADAISLEDIREATRLLYNANNQVSFIASPRQQ